MLGAKQALLLSVLFQFLIFSYELQTVCSTGFMLYKTKHTGKQSVFLKTHLLHTHMISWEVTICSYRASNFLLARWRHRVRCEEGGGLTWLIRALGARLLHKPALNPKRSHVKWKLPACSSEPLWWLSCSLSSRLQGWASGEPQRQKPSPPQTPSLLEHVLSAPPQRPVRWTPPRAPSPSAWITTLCRSLWPCSTLWSSSWV